MTGLTIPLLFGSVRHDRAGIRACRWIMTALVERGHHPVLVDAAALDLPLLDRMYKEFAPGTARRSGRAIRPRRRLSRGQRRI